MNQTTELSAKTTEETLIVEFGSDLRKLDDDQVSQVEQQLLSLVKEHPNGQLILNMHEVQFFGSSFIESLIRVWNEIKSRQPAQMVFCCLQDYCKEIFSVTHLDGIWPIVDSEEEALQLMK